MKNKYKILRNLEKTIDQVMKAEADDTLVQIVKVRANDGCDCGFIVQPSPKMNDMITNYRTSGKKKEITTIKEKPVVADANKQIIRGESLFSRLPKSEKKLGIVCFSIDNFSKLLGKDAVSFNICKKSVEQNNLLIQKRTIELVVKIEQSKEKYLDDKFAISREVSPSVTELNNLCSRTRKDVATMLSLSESADKRNEQLNKLIGKFDESSVDKPLFNADLKPDIIALKDDTKIITDVFKTESVKPISDYRNIKSSFDKVLNDFKDFCESPSQKFEL